MSKQPLASGRRRIAETYRRQTDEIYRTANHRVIETERTRTSPPNIANHDIRTRKKERKKER